MGTQLMRAAKTKPESKNKEMDDLRENFQNFVYTLSHDLSGPIRSVVAFSELLVKHCGSQLDDKAKNYLSFIVDSGEKAQAMLAGLLEYSRLETRPAKFEIVDTRSVVNNCISSLGDIIKTKNAHIQIGELPVIKADEAKLYRLFLSLIDNALKFHKQGQTPNISIHAEHEKDKWRFWIEDEGIGINQNLSGEIFNVFRRLHRENEFPGIGMGLSLAKKIVEQHEGEIGVSSIQGDSSAFYFTLPALSENISQKHFTKSEQHG